MNESHQNSILCQTGKVGLQEYDRYQTLAAIMMFYHKYSIFLVFVLVATLLCFTAHPHKLLWSRFNDLCADAAETRDEKEIDSLSCSPSRPSSSLPFSLRSLICVTFALFYTCAFVSYKLLLVNYTPEHAIEECVVFNFTWAGLAMAFFLFQAIEDLIRPLSLSPPPSSSLSDKKTQ